MACGTPLCFFKPILAVAAVAGVGMGGYNVITTGCPLGSCSAERAGPAASMLTSAESVRPAPCCESEGEAELVLVADGVEATDACEQSCEEACTEAALEECPLGCEGGSETELVSDEREPTPADG